MQREPNEEGRMQENSSLLIRFFVFNRLTLYHPINFVGFTFRKKNKDPKLPKIVLTLLKGKDQTAEKNISKGD